MREMADISAPKSWVFKQIDNLGPNLASLSCGPRRLGHRPGLLETGVRDNPRSEKRQLPDHIAIMRELWIVTSARRLTLYTREGAEPLRTRDGWTLQLLCESLARGFRVSRISGEPR